MMTKKARLKVADKLRKHLRDIRGIVGSMDFEKASIRKEADRVWTASLNFGPILMGLVVELESGIINTKD